MSESELWRRWAERLSSLWDEHRETALGDMVRAWGLDPADRVLVCTEDDDVTPWGAWVETPAASETGLRIGFGVEWAAYAVPEVQDRKAGAYEPVERRGLRAELFVSIPTRGKHVQPALAHVRAAFGQGEELSSAEATYPWSRTSPCGQVVAYALKDASPAAIVVGVRWARVVDVDLDALDVDAMGAWVDMVVPHLWRGVERAYGAIFGAPERPVPLETVTGWLGEVWARHHLAMGAGFGPGWTAPFDLGPSDGHVWEVKATLSERGGSFHWSRSEMAYAVSPANRERTYVLVGVRVPSELAKDLHKALEDARKKEARPSSLVLGAGSLADVHDGEDVQRLRDALAASNQGALVSRAMDAVTHALDATLEARASAWAIGECRDAGRVLLGGAIPEHLESTTWSMAALRPIRR